MIAATIVLASCGGDNTANPEISDVGESGLLCEAGCVESDSFPSQPGVWVGSAVTPDFCISGSYTDADQDALGDFCENALANAFAPELVYGTADNTGREPRWVARALPGDTIRIGYLLSYYVDLGTDDPLCENVIGLVLCAGHYGDVEHIFLDVTYEASTRHWILRRAYYSKHNSHNIYSAANKPYPLALTYPVRAGGYPRAYVAHQKHANYSNPNECDAAQSGFEDCLTQVYQRLVIGQNLGSRNVPFVNCVASSNPIYSGNGVLECYWTNSRFTGWQGAQPDCVGYSGILATFGF